MSINYSNETNGPWPRIFKILGVAAIVFGGLRVGISAGLLLGVPAIRHSWEFWLPWALDVCGNIFLVAGGLRLLIRPGRYQLLLLAAWLWCIATALFLIYQALVSLVSGLAIGYLPFSILHAGIQTMCPALVVLFLTEYRKSRQITPQPALSPALWRWPGPPSDHELRVTDC